MQYNGQKRKHNKTNNCRQTTTQQNYRLSNPNIHKIRGFIKKINVLKRVD